MHLGIPEDDKWIRRYHRSAGSGVLLVCFPHAGGSASYYFSLSKALAASAEVLSVQYPGRQDRRQEPFINNIPDLADQVFEALLPWSDRPFVFFGHSMGATLSFEVARRFQERTERGPLQLLASGRRAPSRYRRTDVHTLDDAGIVAELRSLGGTESRALADPEVLGLALPAIRNDYQAIESYVYMPGPPLRCPVTVLVGDSDPQASIDEAAAWKDHSTGDFDLRVFPGGHFYLEACKENVIDMIRTVLQGFPHPHAKVEVRSEV